MTARYRLVFRDEQVVEFYRIFNRECVSGLPFVTIGA